MGTTWARQGTRKGFCRPCGSGENLILVYGPSEYRVFGAVATRDSIRITILILKTLLGPKANAEGQIGKDL
jgi:hypothetical protein